MTKLHPAEVQSLWLLSNAGQIGELGGHDTACRPFLGDPVLRFNFIVHSSFIHYGYF